MALTFQYRRRTGILYRLPAGAKLAALFSAVLVIMTLPVQALAVSAAAAVLLPFLAGWTADEFCVDARPALFYALPVYTAGLVNALLAPPAAAAFDMRVFLPDINTLRSVFRHVSVSLFAALVFRTTTSIEVKETLCGVELKLRALVKKRFRGLRIDAAEAPLATALALTLSFIPETAARWNNLTRAWRARGGRGGRGGIQKMRVLLFSLITLSFYAAAQKAKALSARGILPTLPAA
jgi:energy-coupling factor transporter transmembrane protein EcfT